MFFCAIVELIVYICALTIYYVKKKMNVLVPNIFSAFGLINALALIGFGTIFTERVLQLWIMDYELWNL
jgi:hypothetical protein